MRIGKPGFSSFISVTREIRPACAIYQTLIWKELSVRLLRSTQLGTLVKDHVAYLVNKQTHNFLSIFLFKWWHCHCCFQILKYKVSNQSAKKLWILKFEKFFEISKFRFWLHVFLRYRLQNAQNTVSDNLVFPPLNTCASGLVMVRLFVGSHLLLKKKPGYGPVLLVVC